MGKLDKVFGKGDKQEAKAYLREVAKDGGWDSYDEFVEDYIVIMAANRLRALARYQAKQGKENKGPKKSKPKAKAA